MTRPGRTRSPALTGSRVTVTVLNGALAITTTVLADRTMPGTVIGLRSTCHRATAVITVAAGAGDFAAISSGDSMKTAVARPTSDIATTPMASPPRKNRLVLSGS